MLLLLGLVMLLFDISGFAVAEADENESYGIDYLAADIGYGLLLDGGQVPNPFVTRYGLGFLKYFEIDSLSASTHPVGDQYGASNTLLSSVQILAVFNYQLNEQISLLFRAGQSRNAERINATGNYSALGSMNGTETSLTFGIGIQYKLLEHLSIRTLFEKVGSFALSQSPTTMQLYLMDAGLVYHF